MKKHGEMANKIYNLLINKINKQNIPIQVFKPLPAPISKIKNKYRWRIIAKGKLSKKVIDMINDTLNEFYQNNRYNDNSRIIVDVNPNNMN